MTVSALLVDDEPAARERLRDLLVKRSWCAVVGEAAGAGEAVAAIERLRPELVFLDVRMPDGDAFAVIEAVGVARMPVVVFVTAYDQHSLAAFDVHAADYLLKPFDEARFDRALDRARTAVEHRRGDSLTERLGALLAHVRLGAGMDAGAPAPVAVSERLAVRTAGRVVFLRMDDIEWLDAAGNSVRIHVAPPAGAEGGGQVHRLRETLGNLESRLDPRRFARIHRSTVVNLDRARELLVSAHGDYVVVMTGGQRLTVSRSFRDRIRVLLGRD